MDLKSKIFHAIVLESTNAFANDALHPFIYLMFKYIEKEKKNYTLQQI